MRKLHPEYLSQTRKKIASKTERLKQLCLTSCAELLLFHGQPGEVYRKCGKENCKCTEGGDARHGPYRIIRVFRDGKNTQVTLTEEEIELYKMAERYQQEITNRKEIIAIQKELLALVDEVLDRRTTRSKLEWKRHK